MARPSSTTRSPRLRDGVGLALLLAAAPAPAGYARAADDATTPGLGIPAEEQPIQTNRSRGDVSLELPLSLNGVYLGDIAAVVRPNDEVVLPTDRLLALVADRVSAMVRDRLTALAGRQASLTELATSGITVLYDPGSLTLDLAVAAAETPLSELSLRSLSTPDPSSGAAMARVAAGVSVIGRVGYLHEAEFEDTGVEPFRADLQGFVSVGGFDGWSLLWAADYDDARDEAWRRGPVTLVHDDYTRALRYRIGDLRPRAEAFQVAPDLLGFSVERDFSAIQPFRNIQPSGRSRFTLERAARVTIEVNGVVIRTLDLPAGPYDIRDFAFAQGSNDVRILVEDAFGRRELASFSTFADIDLLERDVSVFGASVGVLREPFSDDGRLDYSDDPAVVAHYARGVTETITLGGQLELSERSSLAGVSAAVGTRFGLVAGQVAVSEADGRGAWAVLARYRLPPVDWRGFSHEVDAQIEHRAQGFASVGDFQPLIDDETRLDLRYLARRGAHFVSATWSEVEAATRSRFLSFTAGTQWRGWSLTASWQPETVQGRFDRAERFLFTVSRRLGRQTAFRGRQATGPRETEIELQRFTARRVGEWGGRLGVSDLAEEGRLDADLSLTTSRGEVDLSHRTQTYARSTEVRRSVSEARLGVGIGYADGRLGFGRPFTDGFVLVSPHPSLEGRRVTLTEGPSGPVAARSDWLGPGLAPVRRAYQPETFAAEVADLPLGYDLGAAQITAFGPVRAGYLYQVGSGASNTVMATLLDLQGQPVPLTMGELRDLDRPGAEATPFFTNRTGRLVAERVAAGRYAVILSDGRQADDIYVAETARGLVDLGPISLRSAP